MTRNTSKEAKARIRSSMRKLSGDEKTLMVAEMMEDIGLTIYATALREAVDEEQNVNPFADY